MLNEIHYSFFLLFKLDFFIIYHFPIFVESPTKPVKKNIYK